MKHKKIKIPVRVKNPHIAMGHQVMAHKTSFLLNMPVECAEPTPAPPIKRKNQSKMTQGEKDRFINGIQTLISGGQYGPHVSHHANMMHNFHGSMGPIGLLRFLPWHRVYLFQLEEMLQSFDSEMFIPYWDWSVDQDIPQWLQGFTPTVIVDGLPRTVVRAPGAHPQFPSLPPPQDVNSTMSETTYVDFTNALEGWSPNTQSRMHNGVHMWVGGIMSNAQYSPTDVLFWLHHANVDRIWAMWQNNHPNQNPNLTGTDAIMDPWSLDEEDTRDTINLGYVYE